VCKRLYLRSWEKREKKEEFRRGKEGFQSPAVLLLRRKRKKGRVSRGHLTVGRKKKEGGKKVCGKYY